MAVPSGRRCSWLPANTELKSARLIILRRVCWAAILCFVAGCETHLLCSCLLTRLNRELVVLVALSSTTTLPVIVLLGCACLSKRGVPEQRVLTGLLVWGSARLLVVTMHAGCPVRVDRVLAATLALEGLSVVIAAGLGLCSSGTHAATTNNMVADYARLLLTCQTWRSVALGFVSIAGPCIGTAYLVSPLATFQPASLLSSASNKHILFAQLTGCNLLFSHTAFVEMKQASDGQVLGTSQPMLVTACVVGILECFLFIWVGAYSEASREALITAILVVWHLPSRGER